MKCTCEQQAPKRLVRLQVKIKDIMDMETDDSITSDEENPFDAFLALHNDNDHYDDLLAIMNPIINGIQRINHVKITNYIETTRAYIEKDFIMHFRLSRMVAYNLIDRFERSDIYATLQVPSGRPPITAEKHVLAYLWFVGHQTASYRDVADRFGVTLSTLFNIITRVTDFLLSIPNIIRLPTNAEMEVTQQYYRNRTGFPGVMGSMDGTHIRIDKPLEDPDSYINRKQYFSIQLQGVINHQRKFIDVFVGYPGSVHDARVFNESELNECLNNICGDGTYILADSAYPCLPHVLVPYRDNGHLTRAQINFNQKLSSCRITSENSFADLKQRFRQLYHFKLRNIVRMVQVIYACCILHNIANTNDMDNFEPPLDDAYPDPALAQHVQLAQYEHEEHVQNTGQIIREKFVGN